MSLLELQRIKDEETRPYIWRRREARAVQQLTDMVRLAAADLGVQPRREAEELDAAPPVGSSAETQPLPQLLGAPA